ncbi:hypothetical protein ASF84_22530 [Pseudomonas sp. Leaf127]|nr:hypothetical protein ASF84_22530 [Pseudomonas sp. Leaf127]
MRKKITSKKLDLTVKKIITLMAAIFIIISFVGYYEHFGENSVHPVIFIKKKPTLQIIFHRVFHPNFETGLHELTDTQRQQMIDYCIYRLGLETQLKTEKEFRACKEQ